MFTTEVTRTNVCAYVWANHFDNATRVSVRLKVVLHSNDTATLLKLVRQFSVCTCTMYITKTRHVKTHLFLLAVCLLPRLVHVCVLPDRFRFSVASTPRAS